MVQERALYLMFYQVKMVMRLTEGTIEFKGKNLLELDVDERSNEGLF